MKKISPALFFLIISSLFCFLAEDLFARQTLHHHDLSGHPSLIAIEEAVQSGVLTLDEAILQKMYVAFAPERLDERFRHDDEAFIKCPFPIQMEFEQLRPELQPSVVAEIDELLHAGLQHSETTSEHLSPSGNFIFYYETEGTHAVPLDDLNGSGIPDHVEHAAFAADSSYRYQVEQAGFKDFLQDEPYEITFRNIGFYGTTTPSGSTTRITVHSTFNNFPENTHPEGNKIGALYATIAHEIKHAIQYTTNRWQGDAGSFDWMEMDATLMEEVVFNDVNDYYNYIMSFNPSTNKWNQNSPHNSSIFGRPELSTPGAYWHVTWMIYYYEKYGIEFWVDVWDRIRQDYVIDNQGLFLDYIDQVLTPTGLSVAQEHILNHVWHMASGPSNSPGDRGFSDRMNYPNSNFVQNLYLPPDSPAEISGRTLFSFAANYINLEPANVTLGQPAFTVEADVDGVGIGVIGYFRDGSTDVQIAVNPNSNRQTLQTTWSWANLVDMNVAVVNTNRQENAEYRLEVSSVIPDEDTISQNYPNPFNPVTNIEFSLNSSKDVKIEVYDRIGRKVSTLVDERLNQGFHSVTFDGSGLASGVYFYRIVTDQRAVTKKMVLVK